MAKTVDITKNREETAKSAYERLSSERNAYITRAEDCAKYTIPSLFPESGSNSSTTFSTPYQSFGAKAVNNLTSKLALALMPPNTAFFKLNPSEEAKVDLQQNNQMSQQVDQQLMRIEDIVMKYVETKQVRVTVTEALKLLIVSGNDCLYLPPQEGGIKLYRLNNYVVKRDALGNWIRLITLDKVAWAALPEDVQNMISKTGQDSGEKKPEDEVEIYTDVQLIGDEYQSYQEVNGEVIQGTEQSFPKDKAPWIPLRMVKVDGESYGRSFVEEYLGDLRSLENLSQAIVELSAICASVYFLVNPNGITRVSKLSKAQSGDFVSGRKEDITVLQLDKYQDLSVAQQTASNIEQRLSYAFLMNSAVQRNGERVTAEEIRYVAGELEDTLGGIYSILAQELQLPLVKRLLAQLESSGSIPPLPEELVEPEVITGVEALGRGHDLSKLQAFLELQQMNPEAQTRLNWGQIMIMEATSLGINTENLIKTDEELQAEQQQQIMASMAEKASPQLARGVVDGMNNNSEGGEQ